MRSSLLIILFFCFVSCKKDSLGNNNTNTKPDVPKVQTKFDTILPNSYLPVYPGSWWKYINTSNNAVITDSTANKYKKDAYTMLNQNGSIVFTSDSFFVPAYYYHLGNNRPSPELMWGYHSHYMVSSSYTANPFLTIVSDSLAIGTYWQATRMGGSSLNNPSWNNEVISKKDTSIQISGITYAPTIVLTTSNCGTFTPIPIMRKYYTKDIGLVKVEYLKRLPYTNGYEENIVSFHINK